MDGRLHVEENEQVAQVKRLLEHVARRQQDVLNYISPPTERSREEGERANGNVSTHSADEDNDVRSVVTHGADDRQRSADYCTTHGELAIFLVKSLRQLAIPVSEPGGETEHLHFLRRLVARADVTQIIQLSAFWRPPEEEGIAERCEMSLAQEAGNDGESKQDQQPRAVRDQRAGECQQCQSILRHRQQ